MTVYTSFFFKYEIYEKTICVVFYEHAKSLTVNITNFPFHKPYIFGVTNNTYIVQQYRDFIGNNPVHIRTVCLATMLNLENIVPSYSGL